MKFSLYIDESGDFESQKGQWVISGFLCEGSHIEIDEELKKRLQNLPSKHSLKSIKSFHLTEFRNNLGHSEAMSIAQDLFAEIRKLKRTSQFITIVNTDKKRIINTEKTYRTMILDMVSGIENIIPEGQELSQLDLVIASRTINGVSQIGL